MKLASFCESEAQGEDGRLTVRCSPAGTKDKPQVLHPTVLLKFDASQKFLFLSRNITNCGEQNEAKFTSILTSDAAIRTRRGPKEVLNAGGRFQRIFPAKAHLMKFKIFSNGLLWKSY